MIFDGLLRRGAAAAEAARERRMERIEAAVREVGWLSVERLGGSLQISGRALVRRWIEDARLRFAGDVG